MTIRAYNLCTNAPWAIVPENLKQILAITQSHLQKESIDLEAVEKEIAKPLNNTRNVERRGAAAIIPVSGPIVRYAGMFTRISGATSIQDLSTDFNTAMEDDSIKSIVLNVDSPGGSTNGINEFSEMVFNARGKKKIVAYAGNMAASAAYWIASAADEIVADETAMLGSIGVIAAVDAAKDPNKINFISNQSPKKRVDPATKEGAAEIQSVIDDLGSVFVSTVARNRAVSVDTVLADFGQGGVMVAARAVNSGLADRLGSFEQVIAELNGETEKVSNQPKVQTNAETEDIPMAEDTKVKPEASAPVIDRAYLNANHSVLVAELKAEGATSERDRIKAIDAAAIPGHEALTKSAKEDPTMDAGAYALQVLGAEKSAGAENIKSLKTEAVKPVPQVDDATTNPEKKTIDASLPIDERAKAEWDADAELRSDFIGGYDAYLTVRKAEENGQVKQHKK